MGVAEAAYTAGLVALGVPNAAAMSTAIAFRMVTYYLLPPAGLGRDCHALAAAALVPVTGALAPLLQRAPVGRVAAA